MLIFWKENLVFLATTKTGSTAYESALETRAAVVLRDPPPLKHLPAYDYERILRPIRTICGDRPFQTMALVREPIDWLGSWYRFRTRPDLEGRPNSTAKISFDAFVDAYCRGKRPSFANVGSQSRFLRSKEGEIGVDHLFRYEARDAFEAFLTARLGVAVTTTHKNVSPKMPLSLSPETEAKLRRKCPQEFEIWEAGRTTAEA